MDVYILKWLERRLILAERDSLKFIEALDSEEARIYYGSPPVEEDREALNLELKVHIERGVNRWISDSRFLLHSLLAAGVFLVTYFFLSYVIRDPLPLVDEILGALVLAVLAWFRLNNQQYQSEKALRKKLELEQKSREITWEHSSLVQAVELYLEQLAQMNPEDRNAVLVSGAVPVFFSSHRQDLGKMYSLLGKRRDRRFKKDYPEIASLFKQIHKYLKHHSSMV